MEYTIQQVTKRTGLPASTLRYYEQECLLPGVKRNAAGHRVYDDQAMDWLELITCLKETDMPISEIKAFVALCGKGDETLEERRNMVLRHKRNVERHIEALERRMDHVNFKVAYYNAACEAGTEAGIKGMKYDPESPGGFEALRALAAAKNV
jgi:DNA-binding transcriptional MerR regulator